MGRDAAERLVRPPIGNCQAECLAGGVAGVEATIRPHGACGGAALSGRRASGQRTMRPARRRAWLGGAIVPAALDAWRRRWLAASASLVRV